MTQERKAKSGKPITSGESGFTIVEMIVVIIVTGILTAIISAFAINYWRYSFLLGADQDTLISRLNAGDWMRENVGASSGLIIQNSIADANVMNADPAYPGGGFWTPLHAIPGNKTVGATGTTTPVFYFKRYSTTNSGIVIMNGSNPYEDEYVLYLNGTTKQLLVRALANAGASGTHLKPTCPPSAATAACPADQVIADDVSSVDLRYFSRTGNPIDWTSIYDSLAGTYTGPDYTVVEVVELTLNLTKKPILQSVNATQNSTVIRIALRNR
jgi:prepilin-type N-terminal cleavage/methylation domain-containing protein